MRAVLIISALLIRDGLTERLLSEVTIKVIVYMIIGALIMDITEFYKGKR